MEIELEFIGSKKISQKWTSDPIWKENTSGWSIFVSDSKKN